MLKHYIKAALGFFTRNKGFSLINIAGFGLSLSVCLFLLILIVDQKNYDGFHAEKDRIYRVISDRSGRDPSSFAPSPAPLADLIRQTFPEVEEVVQIYNRMEADTGSVDKMLPLSGIAATPNFLTVFNFPLVEGETSSVLQEPRSIVLTQSTVRKLYENQNPIGQTITIGRFGDFTVTGVVKDAPANSHMAFDFIMSFSTMALLENEEAVFPFSTIWRDTNRHFNYLLMEQGASPAIVQNWLDQQAAQHYPEPSEFALKFRLQPLTKIALGELLENEIRFGIPSIAVLFLSLLAVLIMLSAGFNYTNLSLARALGRAREVGIRKVSGASRKQLFLQFTSEATILATVAFVVAVVLLELVLLPSFSNLWVVQMLGFGIQASLTTYLICFVFCLVTGSLAGMVPAWYLSAWKPEQVLKGISSTGVSKLGMRKVLIILQFILAMVFITTVFTIKQQMNYMLDIDYGYNPQNIINVELQGQDSELLRNELNAFSDIESISASSLLPSTDGNRAMLARRSPQNDFFRLYFIDVDINFIPNLEITLIAGRNFHDGLDPTQGRYIIINETAVTAFGFNSADEAIGQTIDIDQSEPLQILGVVEDIHYRELLGPIGPFMLRYFPPTFEYLNIRAPAGELDETLKALESAWERVFPAYSLSYGLYEDQIEDNLGIFSDLSRIVGLASVLSLSIALLGLMGIAALNSEERLHELGIRKVVGATDLNLLNLLSRNFMLLLTLAILIAAPMAWFLNSMILQNFPYHIESPIEGLLFAIFTLGALGSLTVISQTIKASMSLPVEILRYE